MPIIVSLMASIMLICSVLALMQGLLLRTGIPGIRAWFLSNILIVTSLPLLVLREQIPDLISIVFANLLMVGSIVSYYIGCSQFLGRPVPWRWLWAGMIVLTINLFFWRYWYDSIPMRVLCVDIVSIILFVAIAHTLLRYRPAQQMPHSFWLAACILIILIIMRVARSIYFLSLPGPSDSDMFLGSGSIALMAIGAVLLPMMGMATLMLIHHAMLARAEHVANQDHVTGALSRKRLEFIALQEFSDAERLGSPLSLLLVDLDHFKQLNDTHGHAAGDTVLREFVRLARSQLRDGDALGRVGGEEFIILLPRTSLDVAMRIAERLRTKVQEHRVDGTFGHCHYSISIGVAAWCRGDTFEQICLRADQAMYQAKRSGRNRVVAADA